MEAIKVLLVDDSQVVLDAMEAFLSTKDDIEVVGSVDNGVSALEFIRGNAVDVMLLDVVMPIMDGFCLLEELRKAKLAKRPRIIMLTALIRDDFIQRAVNSGADYYMLKPYEPEVVYQRIHDLMLPQLTQEAVVQAPQVTTYSMDERIANIFLSMGIPAHIKGYHFLREAIKLVVEKPEMINAITKDLYPTVARNFNTSSSKVERAIRHAIDVAWTRGQVENINQLFGSRVYVKTDKPTNGEFIALIADRLSIEKSA